MISSINYNVINRYMEYSMYNHYCYYYLHNVIEMATKANMCLPVKAA